MGISEKDLREFATVLNGSNHQKSLFCARMGRFVGFAKSFLGDVGVDLRGGK